MSRKTTASEFLLKKPTYRDFFLFAVFAVLITYQPFYLFGKMNLFEMGIYLPGIDGILDGQIPYRDFYYLRGWPNGKARPLQGSRYRFESGPGLHYGPVVDASRITTGLLTITMTRARAMHVPQSRSPVKTSASAAGT